MFLSFYTIFQQGVHTHCHVNNFALSVSEAIAVPQMSRVIWTIAVVIHAPFKLFFAIELTKFYIDYVHNKVNVYLRLEYTNV